MASHPSRSRRPTEEELAKVEKYVDEDQLALYAKGEWGVYGGAGLAEGSAIPAELTLYTTEKALARPFEKLTVLNFGSCSCPPWRANVGKFEGAAADFDDVDFFYVYVEEAHPVGGWLTLKGGVPIDPDPAYYNQITDAATLEERIDTATAWHKKSNLTRELLVDDPATDAVGLAFAARPERLYIVQHGKVLYQGGEGPFHYDVDDMLTNLHRIVQQQKNSSEGDDNKGV